MDRDDAIAFYEDDEDLSAVRAAFSASTVGGTTAAPVGIHMQYAANIRLEDVAVGVVENLGIPAVQSSELVSS